MTSLSLSLIIRPYGERGTGALMGRGLISGFFIPLLAVTAFAEVFVADFNGDGKPDVLMSSAAAPDGFVVLINQGEIDGKISFKKTTPDVHGNHAGQSMTTAAAPAISEPAELPTAPYDQSPSWKASPAAPAKAPAAVSTPPAVSVKPSIQPPPAPALSTGAPKLKPIGGPAPAPAAAENRPKMMEAPPARTERSAERAPQAALPSGSRRTALFNYKDKTAGSQFAWLERGIANILKFDILEVKSVQMVDRERTDVTFDPAWFRDSGLMADIIITGEFEEAGERLVVTTWFLTSSMSSLREFRVEGDRSDIFSLIEKVGTKLKQELSSL